MEAARPPVRISAVVDRSGSMSGERLQLVQRTLAFVVRELTAKDEFGIVAYDDTISEPLTLTRMDAAGKHIAQAAIQALEAGGCTDLSGGLLAGIDQVGGRAFVQGAPSSRRSFRRGQGLMIRNHFNPQQRSPMSSMLQSQVTVPQEEDEIPVVEKPTPLKEPVAPPAKGTVSAVWLFTDGRANCGITDTPGIIRAMQERMSGLQATSVFTFGYGRDHNEAMLRAISEAASGMYYFIDTPESIPSAFAECLGGVLSVVAQDLKVEVKTTRGVKLLRILGRTDAVMEGDSTARLVLKDLYAEEERDLLFELEVSTSADSVLAQLALAFSDAQSGARRQVEASVGVGRPDKHPAKQETHTRVDEQRNRVQTAESLAKARAQADAGDLPAAREALLFARQNITTSATSDHACNVDLLEDLADTLDGLASRSVWERQGRKVTMQTEQCHYQQRSSALSTPARPHASKERYTNAGQKQLKKKSATILSLH